MKPKPDLMTYGREDFEYENWKRDTLVWCAETMVEAADTMERCMNDRPTPQPPATTLISKIEKKITDSWLSRASLGARLRYWTERSQQ